MDVQPVQALDPQVAPAPVDTVVPETPEPPRHVDSRIRRRVDAPTGPRVAPAAVEPVAARPPEAPQRVATQARQRVETPERRIDTRQAAPEPVTRFAPTPPRVQQRTAARARQRVDVQPERVARPPVATAAVTPVTAEPTEQRRHHTRERGERVVAPAPERPSEIRAVEPLQPVALEPAPQRRSAAPRRLPAPARATRMPAPRRVAGRSSTSLAALPQERRPSEEGIRQAQRERDALESYLGHVFQKLESHKRYPRAAERNGLNGQVVLRFTVRRDGEVLNPEVVEISGHESFRNSALRALTRVGQLPPFPSDIRRPELLVDVPITYRIEDR